MPEHTQGLSAVFQDLDNALTVWIKIKNLVMDGRDVVKQPGIDKEFAREYNKKLDEIWPPKLNGGPVPGNCFLSLANASNYLTTHYHQRRKAINQLTDTPNVAGADEEYNKLNEELNEHRNKMRRVQALGGDKAVPHVNAAIKKISELAECNAVKGKAAKGNDIVPVNTGGGIITSITVDQLSGLTSRLLKVKTNLESGKGSHPFLEIEAIKHELESFH